MKYEFQSGFASQIKNMLEHREVMGYSVLWHRQMLANFDRFCYEKHTGESILTKEIAFAWCNDAEGSKGANKACAIRGLARYILAGGNEAYVMPTAFFPQQKAKLPYIMNDNEIKSFFEAANRYPGNSINPLLGCIVPVIFRLQYACGMRPQEVRRLRCIDFNYNDNTIYIVEGKHNKDRCIPVNQNIMNMCKEYNQIAEILIPHREYFFQSPRGGFYTAAWHENIFRKCWGMSENGARHGYCTPYILRHNYATQTLMRWIEEGKNLDAMIPYLSAYMGHEKFSATYYYIHLLPERLARMDFTGLDGIIPEVIDYEED